MATIPNDIEVTPASVIEAVGNEDPTVDNPPAADPVENDKEPVIEDVDEVEAREAAAQAAAEEAGSTPSDEEAKGEKEPPKPDTQPKQPAPADSLMVPKQRFDEVLRRSSTAEQEAAYWKGVAEGKTPAPAAEKQPEADQQDRLASIEEEKIALFQEYEDGEITAAEYKRADIALDRQFAEVVSQTRSQPSPSTSATDLLLEERTEAIIAAHPFSAPGVITDPADHAEISRQALKQLANDGVRYDPNNHLSLLRYREAYGKVTDMLGPIFTGKTLAELTGSSTEVVRPKPAVPQISDTAKDRQAALDRVRDLPPDTNRVGTPADGDEMTAAQFVALSDEDIELLPASVRERFAPT